MKKLYTTLALAAAVAFGASAAAPKAAKKQLKDMTQLSQQAIEMPATIAPVKAANNGAQKAPSTIDELVGMYIYNFTSISSEIGEVEAGLSIVAGEQPNQVAFDGWITLDGIGSPVGTVDFNAKTITLPFQKVGTYEGYDIFFGIIYGGDDKKLHFNENNPYVFTIGEDGTLSSEYAVGFGSEALGGFFSYFSGYNLTMTKFKVEDFDLEGWTKAGTCTYQDAGWVLNGVFGHENALTLPGLEAEYYTKEMLCEIDEEMHTYLAVYQPYAQFNAFMNENLPEWVEEGVVNTSEATGAVVFDITFPECVMTMQGYYSGMKMEGDYYWNWNGEYYEYYFNDFMPEDIVSGYDEVSTFDESANVIEVHNCYFGINADKTASYRWTDREGEALPTLAVVALTPGGESGLNTVITDNNAPVEYYNLQGVRVADDAKGLVIRKQGNNVAKVIR